MVSFFDTLKCPWKRGGWPQVSGRDAKYFIMHVRGGYGVITLPSLCIVGGVFKLQSYNYNNLKEMDILYDCLYSTACPENSRSKFNTITRSLYWSCA